MLYKIQYLHVFHFLFWKLLSHSPPPPQESSFMQTVRKQNLPRDGIAKLSLLKNSQSYPWIPKFLYCSSKLRDFWTFRDTVVSKSSIYITLS